MAYCTANPDADFAEYDADQESAEAADEAHRNRLGNQFINAAKWGADETALKGYTVGLCLGEMLGDNPDLLNAFFYKAVHSTDPVWRAMVNEVADAYVAHFRTLLPKD